MNLWSQIIDRKQMQKVNEIVSYVLLSNWKHGSKYLKFSVGEDSCFKTNYCLSKLNPKRDCNKIERLFHLLMLPF